MGDWKMSKPDLRAGLEADLKLVCEGRKTKEEVIHPWSNICSLRYRDQSLIDASFQVLEAQVSKYKEVFQGTVESVARSDILKP